MYVVRRNGGSVGGEGRIARRGEESSQRRREREDQEKPPRIAMPLRIEPLLA